MVASLRAGGVGRHHDALVLDRAGAHENLPVLQARMRPLGGQEHQPRAIVHQAAEKLGEAQIVADGQARPSPRGIADHDLVARGDETVLVHDRERVELLIARHEPALRAHHDQDVMDVIAVAQQRRACHGHAVRACEVAHGRDRVKRAGRVHLGGRAQRQAGRPQLRQHHQVAATSCAFTDGARSGLHVALRLIGGHRHLGNRHHKLICHPAPANHATRSAPPAPIIVHHLAGSRRI